MGIVLFLYIQLSVIYSDISWVSMLCAFILGFVFFFCDPNEYKYENIRLWAIILLIGGVALGVVILFFKTNPPLVVI